jgi:hypothetical protein
MANLKTLDGIAEAREDLYNKLERGDINEVRAMAQERVLRGQSELKATVPLRLLAIIAKSRTPAVQKYGEPLMRAVLKFTTGAELPLIEGPTEAGGAA